MTTNDLDAFLTSSATKITHCKNELSL